MKLDGNHLAVHGLRYAGGAICSATNPSGPTSRFICGTAASGRHNELSVIELDAKNNKTVTLCYAPMDGEVETLIFGDQKKLFYSVVVSSEKRYFLHCSRIEDLEDGFCSIKELTEAGGIELVDTIRPNMRNARLVDSPMDDRVLVVSGNSIRTYDPSSEEVSLLYEHDESFLCADWDPLLKHCFCLGCYSGGLNIFDLRVPDKISEIPDVAGSGQTLDLDYHPHKAFTLLSTSQDGRVKVWDLRHTEKPVISQKVFSHWGIRAKYNALNPEIFIAASTRPVCSVFSLASGKIERITSIESGHQDVVMDCCWAATDDSAFASLSVDGSVVIAKLPQAIKDQYLS